MNDRTGFLLARIADDEAHARSAFGEHNDVEPEWSEIWSGAVSLGGDSKSWDELLITNDSQVSRHIARFDPARVLAECEAKRQIVKMGEQAAALQQVIGPDLEIEGYMVAIEDALKALVQLYADHKDFQQEWLP